MLGAVTTAAPPELLPLQPPSRLTSPKVIDALIRAASVPRVLIRIPSLPRCSPLEHERFGCVRLVIPSNSTRGIPRAGTLATRIEAGRQVGTASGAEQPVSRGGCASPQDRICGAAFACRFRCGSQTGNSRVRAGKKKAGRPATVSRRKGDPSGVPNGTAFKPWPVLALAATCRRRSSRVLRPGSRRLLLCPMRLCNPAPGTPDTEHRRIPAAANWSVLDRQRT